MLWARGLSLSFVILYIYLKQLLEELSFVATKFTKIHFTNFLASERSSVMVCPPLKHEPKFVQFLVCNPCQFFQS